MNGEFPYTQEDDELTQELKYCAFDVLRENPQSDYEDWRKNLLAQYPAEVVDALGTEPFQVYATLAQWWDEVCYGDALTGLEKTYKEWAEIFSSDGAVELYNELANAMNEIENLKAQIKFLKSQNTPEKH